MSLDTRITLFGIACVALGWAWGYAQCWVNQSEKLRKSRERFDAAYTRYWNGYDGDEF